MIDELLLPVADGSPSGPSFEYDHRFQSLVSASHGRDEQQLGSNIVPAADPDWHFLLGEAAALLKESRDIRLLVIWTYASLRLSGLEGLAEGVEAIARLIEQRWDSIHPVIEPDGDGYIRANAVSGLADPESMLRVLRDQAVDAVQGMTVTVRQVSTLADGHPADGCPVATFEQLRTAIQSGAPDAPARFAACSRILTGLASIEGTFRSRLGSDSQPSLQPLQHIVEALKRLYEPPLVQPSVLAPDADDAGRNDSSLPDLSQPLRSRGEALKALAKAREYFERHEPSSPAALLIRRVEHLASSSFLEIMEQMAPASLDHIKMQAGLDR